MKMLSHKLMSSASLLLCMIVVTCALQSCENEGSEIYRRDSIEGVKDARAVSSQIPKVRLVDSSGENSRTSDFSNPEAFDFSDDTNGGFSFSSSADITFEEAPDGGYMVVDINSLSGGGGSVTVGTNSYDVSVAFCFSSEDPLGLVEDELPGDGFSGVVGFAGAKDIESLEDLEDFENHMEAIVYYIVLDEQPEGEYEVVSDDSFGEENDDAVAFAMIFDFKQGKTYLSSRGTLAVNNNSMTFDGHYYELTNENSEEVREVAGSGTVGCF